MRPGGTNPIDTLRGACRSAGDHSWFGAQGGSPRPPTPDHEVVFLLNFFDELR